MRSGAGGGGQPAAEYHQHETRQGSGQNQEVLDNIVGRGDLHLVTACLVSGQDCICKEAFLTRGMEGKLHIMEILP